LKTGAPAEWTEGPYDTKAPPFFHRSHPQNRARDPTIAADLSDKLMSMEDVIRGYEERGSRPRWPDAAHHGLKDQSLVTIAAMMTTLAVVLTADP
jgi:hypothetical protein